MKKLFPVWLVGCLFFPAEGCTPAQEEPTAGAPEDVGALPGFGFESDYMSMAQIGAILERMGRQIQQTGAVTFADRSYPITGYGGIEFSLNRRPGREGVFRTGLQMLFDAQGSSDPPTPPEGRAYTVFEGATVQGEAPELADAVDAFANTLESTGRFTWDFHSTDFAGTAIIDQYLGQNTRNPRQPYRMIMDIAFGEGEVQRHEDREDETDPAESGAFAMLGSTMGEGGANQAGVVESLRALASGIRTGEIQVGEGRVEFTGEGRLSFGHVVMPGGSDKIELGLQWTTTPPPEPPAEGEGPPQYHDEPTAMPVSEFVALLRRMAAEIQRTGTFAIGDQVYTVGDTISGEIYFSNRGMSIEVGWRR